MDATERRTWEQRRRSRNRYGWLAVWVGISLLLLKSYAAWMTGSKAILSDAVESVVNVLASGLMLMSLKVAHAPADEDHPFGHGRAEALTAGLEGAFLIAAAIGILWAAVPAFFDPQPLDRLGLGLIIVAFATVANLLVGWVLARAGRRHASMALVADGKHLMGDAVTSGALLLGIGAVALTGLPWLDPALACALALWVGITGVGVVRDSVRSLMNEQRPEDVERIAQSLETEPPVGMMDPHDLRILDAGTERFVELHVRAPRDWSLGRAEQLSREVAERLAGTFVVPVTPIVQVESCMPEDCPVCVDHCRREDAEPGPVPAVDRVDRERLVAPAERLRRRSRE